jgi:hypothetical protein
VRTLARLAMAAAVAVALVAVGVAAMRSPADPPAPDRRDDRRAAPPREVLCDGPAPGDCAVSPVSVAELAARLRADPAARDARAVPRPGTAADGLAVAARLERTQCRRSSWPFECHVAVASRSIRRLYRGMRRSADHRRKAAVLLGVGARLEMSRLQVVNAIRAELDVQLTRAVAARRLPGRGRQLALRCYDEPRACGPI